LGIFLRLDAQGTRMSLLLSIKAMMCSKLIPRSLMSHAFAGQTRNLALPFWDMDAMCAFCLPHGAEVAADRGIKSGRCASLTFWEAEAA
jgi:hypothetical protein